MKEVHNVTICGSSTGNRVIALGTSASLEMRGLVQISLRSIVALMVKKKFF